jgi:hypothetical protein
LAAFLPVKSAGRPKLALPPNFANDVQLLRLRRIFVIYFVVLSATAARIFGLKVSVCICID